MGHPVPSLRPVRSGASSSPPPRFFFFRLLFCSGSLCARGRSPVCLGGVGPACKALWVTAGGRGGETVLFCGLYFFISIVVGGRRTCVLVSVRYDALEDRDADGEAVAQESVAGVRAACAGMVKNGGFRRGSFLVTPGSLQRVHGPTLLSSGWMLRAQADARAAQGAPRTGLCTRFRWRRRGARFAVI